MARPLLLCLCSCITADARQLENLIPKQLIMTGKPDTLAEMPEDVKKNVANNLRLISQDVKFRWFGDRACHQYIKDHYDADLLHLFDTAYPGYYKGDICRAAILYQEGGFYLDVDLQLSVSLASLVDLNTTFASAYSINGDIFNAMIATVPKSNILRHTLNEMRKWYGVKYEDLDNEDVVDDIVDKLYRWNDDRSHPNELMGTRTMFRGMQHAMKAACGLNNLLEMRGKDRWSCGKHVMRMYEEDDLWCFPRADDPHREKWLKECPEERKKSPHYGLRLGLFQAGDGIKANRYLIGYPRFGACSDDMTGCGSGGHAPSEKTTKPAMVRAEVKAHEPSKLSASDYAFSIPSSQVWDDVQSAYARITKSPFS